MKKINNRSHGEKHEDSCLCSLCNCRYTSFTFKNGYVCEECRDYIKNNFHVPETPRKNK